MDNEKFQELILNQFEKFDQRFDKIDQRFEKIDQRFEKIDQRFEKIDQRFEKIDQRFDKLEQSIIRIESEHGDKLSALLDGYKQNAEILADHTLRLERIEEKIATHDIQIHVLDKTKSNKRKAK